MIAGALFLAGAVTLVGGSSLIGVRQRRRAVHLKRRLGTTAATAQNSRRPRVGRRDQLRQIQSADDFAANRRVHRRQSLNIAIASLTVVTATAGATLVPVLTPLSLIGIFFVGKDAAIDGARLFLRKRVIGVDALSVLIKVLLVINYQIVLCSVSVLIYACNRKLMHSVKDHSKSTVIDAFRQFPRAVYVRAPSSQSGEDSVETEIDLQSVKIGDIVVVNAGELIPVDGVILDGQALIDQHRLNGESQPAERGVGDTVFALTTVLSGRVGVRTQRTGEGTTAAQIAQTLAQTVDFKTDMQLWAEALTNRTVLPTVVVGAVLTPWIGLTNAAAFLYSHPKYKTTLTGSLSLLNTLNQSSALGILVKDGRTFELLNRVDTVVFDKTGTLTLEQPRVDCVHTRLAYGEDDVLRLAAAAEQRQSHPIARAILALAEERRLTLPSIEHPDYQLGLGLTVKYEGRALSVGSLRFIGELADLDAELLELQGRCHAQGHTLVGIALDGQVIGAVELHARVRAEASEVIQGLRQHGIDRVLIISGDHQAPTAQLAAELGVDGFFAETLPAEKAQIIRSLQEEGRAVCYVGDGINDAIALSQAEVSISLSGASSVAMDSSQAILMDQTLKHLCPLFDLARAGRRNMRQTFAIVVIPHMVSASVALVLHQAFVSAMVLTLLGLFGGVGNALRPMERTASDATDYQSGNPVYEDH